MKTPALPPRHSRAVRRASMVAAAVAIAASATAQSQVSLLPGGDRVRIARGLDLRATSREFTPAPRVPIGGFLLHAVAVLTDKNAGNDLDWYGVPEHVFDGEPLGSDPTRDWVPVLLDSGAGTDLLGYDNSLIAGLTGSSLTENEFGIGGVCGELSLLASEPLAVFVGGIQHVDASGLLDLGETVGHSNFSVGVNTAANVGLGLDIPSVVGTGLFAQHTVVVNNEEPVLLEAGDDLLCSPAIEFYPLPDSVGVPDHPHRFFLEVLPGGDPTPAYFGYPDDFGTFHPMVPSTLGLASALFFTASDVTLTDGVRSGTGSLVVDSGAQGTVISEILATELGLDLENGEFMVELAGFGCVEERPGYVVDELRIVATGGDLVIEDVPVIVVNIASPEGGTLDGILGTNLFFDRNLVYACNDTPPWVGVSDPIDGVVRITDARRGPDGLAVAWEKIPAAGPVALEQASGAGVGDWTETVVDENDTAVCVGEFLFPEPAVARAVYRLRIP